MGILHQTLYNCLRASTLTMSANSSTTAMDNMKFAQDLLEDAKINPCIPEALDDLSEVCEIFAKTHGVHAEICAEPFFYYGKALLGMSKIESAVLGNCLEGFDHEIVAMLHRGEEEFDQDSDSEEEPDETEPEAEGEPDGDEIGHLELAWEMLELAKLIWATCGKTDMEAEALQFLGEMSLESNNYPQAVEDLSKAVSIKVKTAPAGSRALAELHYQLGVAYAWAGNWPLAEKCLADAAAVLVTRMASHPTENEELECIISDIKGRIVEHKEMEKGVFSDSYVKAPGGKILSNLGVAGAVGSGKTVATGTVGTA